MTLDLTNPVELPADIDLIARACLGERGGDQQRIAEEIARWGALMLRKNHDYGGAVWDRPILAPECEAGTAIRVRMSDKLSRMISLLEKGGAEVDESFDDTLRDLGAYCLLELSRPDRKAS